jgi:hypothetical protein
LEEPPRAGAGPFDAPAGPQRGRGHPLLFRAPTEKFGRHGRVLAPTAPNQTPQERRARRVLPHTPRERLRGFQPIPRGREGPLVAPGLPPDRGLWLEPRPGPTRARVRPHPHGRDARPAPRLRHRSMPLGGRQGRGDGTNGPELGRRPPLDPSPHPHPHGGQRGPLPHTGPCSARKKPSTQGNPPPRGSGALHQGRVPPFLRHAAEARWISMLGKPP